MPKQLIVRSPKAKRNITPLLHGTTLLDIVGALPDPANVADIEHMRVFAVPAALVACSPIYFVQNPTDTRAVLATLRDASDVLPILLNGGHTVIAGRLAGAFRNIGRARIADDILKAMRAAGYEPRENDPFATPAPFAFSAREPSPYANRIRLMWQQMRAPILEAFPAPPGVPNDIHAYLTRVQEIYVTDAYHSLSIEGYRVTPQLIERVRSGTWNPDADEADRAQRDALAARGYWQAFQAVRQSLSRILAGENPGAVADDDHGTWFRELFAPSVTAGIIQPGDLAGYRNAQVYIRRSRHVPLNPDGVRDAMPAFFDLLRDETEPAVRAVLGHFVFVYIHPYMDGNGRMGRFMMNAMLASGGYPWTVVPLDERNGYMSSLEAASVDQDIRPFARFLAELVVRTQTGHPAATIPGASP